MTSNIRAHIRRILDRSGKPTALTMGLALLPMLPQALHAQATDESATLEQQQGVDEIVITGSRIRGVAPVGSAMISLGRAEIDASPGITAVDLLREVPQVVNLGNDASHRGVQGGQANTRFASGVNLRGIGPNATLLLVDGNRMPSSGNLVHFVDPSVIPTVALQRMEVVADGASAVYGSDAVAGVVNMILRDDFQGAETSVRFGVADDYDKRQISQLFGFGWESGNLMLAYENSFNSNLVGGDRSWYTSDQTPRGGQDYRSAYCNPGTLIVGGVRYAIPAGQDGTALDPSQLVPNTENLCDDIRNTDLLPRSDRHSVIVKGTQELTDRVRLNTMGFYSERDFRIHGYLDTSRANAALLVPNTNPFFVSPDPSATSVTVNHLFPEEFGLSTNYGTSDSWIGIADLTADLFADWRGVLKGSYGESKDLIKTGNAIITPALNAALRSSDPNTAYNPFGDGSGMNPAVLDSIRGEQVADVRHRLITASLEANGTLFELPAGRVALAVGAEHREERYGVDTLRTDGSRSVDVSDREVQSAYAELFIPILRGVTLIDSLDASLAIRYDRYNDFGSTTNPKFGVNWSPTPGLTMKASYGTSFRAPSLSEINATPTIFQRVLADPLSPTGQSTGLSIAGGNDSLDPEEAKTWSFGTEWEPDAVPGLRLGLNYFEVEYTGQILDLHGIPSRLADPAYSAYVIRNPSLDQIQTVLDTGWMQSGVINPAVVTFIIDGRRQNLGVTNANGFDLQALYNWSGVTDRFAVGLGGSYFTKYEVAPSSTAPTRDMLNKIDNPLRHRVRATFAWERGPFTTTAYFNHSSSYENNLIPNPERVSAWSTVDLNVSYDVGRENGGVLDGLTIALLAENAFDKRPPYVDRADGFDPQVSSAIGRLISLSIRKKW